MNQSEYFIHLMYIEERLRIFFSVNFLIGFLAKYLHLWEYLAFYTAIVINLIVLGSYS